MIQSTLNDWNCCFTPRPPSWAVDLAQCFGRLGTLWHRSNIAFDWKMMICKYMQYANKSWGTLGNWETQKRKWKKVSDLGDTQGHCPTQPSQDLAERIQEKKWTHMILWVIYAQVQVGFTWIWGPLEGIHRKFWRITRIVIFFRGKPSNLVSTQQSINSPSNQIASTYLHLRWLTRCFVGQRWLKFPKGTCSAPDIIHQPWPILHFFASGVPQKIRPTYNVGGLVLSWYLTPSHYVYNDHKA